MRMNLTRAINLPGIKFRQTFLLIVLFIVHIGCSRKADSSPAASSPKFEQYFVHGEQLYQIHCSNCHQKTGVGLGLLYPPLNTSDFLDNHFEEAICLIKNGIAGELLVNGKSYNKAMPGVRTLTDLEIAEIATYIYNSWANERGIIEVREVSRILLECDTIP